MANANDLYAELSPDIELLADVLFELSEKSLREQGNFLPHAAVLTDEGEVELVAAAPPSDVTNSTEVLPLLHDGLRLRAMEGALRAIAVSENVTVALQGQPRTKAIKVLVEHVRGLTVALYLPFEKRLLRGHVIGQRSAVAARAEVKVWSQSPAAFPQDRSAGAPANPKPRVSSSAAGTEASADLQLAFILLADPVQPDAQRVARTFAERFGDTLSVESGDVLTLRTSGGMEAFVTFLAAPIQTGEVEAAAELSTARFFGAELDPRHAAHLIVATPGVDSLESRLEQSKLVGAIADACGAPGIYDGHAHAAHPTSFYLQCLEGEGLPVPLWTGVSLGPEKGDRVSLLTHGLASLGVPNLLISVRHSELEAGLDFLFHISEYVLNQGAPPPHGDTVGRSSREKLRVRHVPSPIDPGVRVVRIEL